MAIVMITGGARSGKSALAEKMCIETEKRVGYIATAVETDDDMRDRIMRHRQRRPDNWITFERYRDFAALAGDDRFFECDVFLMDCVTTMITNHMMDSGLCFDTCGLGAVQALEDGIRAEVDSLIAVMKTGGKRLVIVTNEVGAGIVPAYRMGSLFRDIAGRINMHIAAAADEVYCTISGLALRLK
ncbi:MAG: bifunctional adenosylcobinamide kinase/adenosylcobinamide-phosphate guanylyltransferase [Eubacteriales bacterium]|nr:bifunctional adenosylcobinamide kinase/adenosylcobinamide-phosphate guanylyltransferase [Eubacteriales bacterium]